MPGPIVIRNLTAQPLTVKLVERYESPNAENFPPNAGFGGKMDNLTSNFTGLMKKDKGGKEEPGEQSKGFEKHEKDIRLEPFRTHRTDIRSSDAGKKEVVRILLRGDGGGQWKVETPTPKGTSTNLTPLSPNLPHEYTAIYNRDSAFLAIFETSNLHQWMKEFNDATPLSALSIPGTHNAPTHHQALPSVRCQAVHPKEQLENGVRFFDVRVQVNNAADENSDDLELCHAVFPISLTGPKKFRGLLNDVYDFLKRNPSETVIMSLKREGRGDANDGQFAERLKKHYINPDQWWTKPGIPKLGEARGKIVLMRRFMLSDRLKQEFDNKGWGIFAVNWADNTPNNRTGDVQVQDFYEVLDTENIDKKRGLVCDHVERAAELVHPVNAQSNDEHHPVFVNFMSASNFWKPGCWPEKIAAKLNPAVTTFLCEKHDIGDKGIDAPDQEVKGDGGTGIIVCDWVGENGDWDLVRAIVGMNGRLLMRQRGQR